MDLSSASRPPNDPLRRLWGPVTIRVAWELLRARVEARGPTLRAARDHALWRLPAAPAVAEAEALAAVAVDEYLARCAGRYEPFSTAQDLDVLPTPAWREAIEAASDPIHEGVLRFHYADGLPLEEVERRSGLEIALLRGARDALRELTREIVGEDGVSVDGWDPARLDALIARIATAAGDTCPGPGGLATDLGRAHADTCPRCSRALRMLREGVLGPGDLFPPEDGPCRPAAMLDLAIIGVQPEARRHYGGLVRRLGDAARVLPNELILVDASRCDLSTILVDLAERGTPNAAHLRVVRRLVPGRWVSRAVIGPGIDDLLGRLQGLAWGEVEGIDALPEPLPPPPSAARWWAAAALAALLAVAAGLFAFRDQGRVAEVPLTVERESGGLVFDTSDQAWVEVVALDGARANVVFHSDSPGSKGAIATGDGRYRVASLAGAHVVIAGTSAFDGLDQVLAVVPATDDPARLLAERVRERFPNAAVEAVGPRN
jgi:hypothetical protein